MTFRVLEPTIGAQPPCAGLDVATRFHGTMMILPNAFPVSA